MKREQKFNTYFNAWVKNVYKKTAAFECKQTTTDSLPFSAVQPHQVQALLCASEGVFVWKIPDAGYQNPFDCFSLVGVPAFVVVKYPGFFCLISIQTFLEERQKSPRKSLTSARAISIATEVIKL